MRSDVPWAALAALAVGVVLGFVLGGVSPRSELADRDARISELQEALDQADTGGWRSPVPGLDRILRAPPDRPTGEATRRGDGGAGELSERGAEPGSDGGAPSPRSRPGWRERMEQATPAERRSAFSRAASVQEVRRVQSRAALREQAGLDDEEMAEVDAALAEMNAELLGHGEELLMLAMGDERPPARDLLGITHDVTGIMHRAQVRLESVLGPDRAGQVDSSALEIWNHVDLRQLEPAARAASARP